MTDNRFKSTDATPDTDQDNYLDQDTPPDYPPNEYPVDWEKLRKAGLFAPVILAHTDAHRKALAVQYQKIAILTEEEIGHVKIREKIDVRFESKATTVKLLRRSECPNPAGEYDKQKTYTVLLQVTELIKAEEALGRFRDWNGSHADTSQSNNFVLSDIEPSGTLPSPPVQAGSPTGTVKESDFQIVSPNDYNHYDTDTPSVVAVVDSGVKFDLANRPHEGSYTYTDHGGDDECEFRLARGKQTDCTVDGQAIGYCGITDYINRGAGIDKLNILKGFTREQIIASAFDDNRVENQAGKETGRHGTYITALVNQHSGDAVSVLPVKAFNCGGFGTLFDVLCCLNFVLAQKAAGLPIQVLNASWVGQLDEDGEQLLHSKFKQLEKAGILVVAAAGNKHHNLNHETLYPACYSTGNRLNNVITVTSVERSHTFIPQVEGDHVEATELTHSEKATILADPDQLRVVRGSYRVSMNYSNAFVSLGVYGGGILSTGVTNPFKDTQTLQGTSFATAIVSGKIAQKLLDDRIILTGRNIGTVKNQLLRELTDSEDSLRPVIQDGRLLKMS